MSIFSDVNDFHIAFDILVADVPTFPDADNRKLRRNLLAEEVQEFFDAEVQNDLVEVADALADITYIICGTMISYGITPKDDEQPVFAALLAGSTPHLPVGLRAGLRNTRIEEIKKFYGDYIQAENDNNLNKISTTLSNLLDSTFTCAYIYGIPLMQVFEEVHRSNMAKLVDGKVLRRADKKIQKPIGWLPPNIAKVLFP